MSYSATMRALRTVARQNATKIAQQSRPITSSGRTMAAAATSSSASYTSPLHEFLEGMKRNETSPLGNMLESSADEAPRRLACGIKEEVLRFSTTSYGRLLEAPFVHTNEHKVTVTINVEDLSLDDKELAILSQIVSGRLSDTHLRMSSNQFGSRIENKRHLVSMLNRIIDSSRRLAAEIDDA